MITAGQSAYSKDSLSTVIIKSLTNHRKKIKFLYLPDKQATVEWKAFAVKSCRASVITHFSVHKIYLKLPLIFRFNVHILHRPLYSWVDSLLPQWLSS